MHAQQEAARLQPEGPDGFRSLTVNNQRVCVGTRSSGGWLLERDDQIAQLSALIEGARTGSGTVVAIEGEAGIGKSSLLTRAAQHGRDAGMLVLTASGGELEQDFGHGVVRQLFDAPITAMRPKVREQLFRGAAATASAVLSDVGADGEALTDQGAVLHGLYWLTANLAERQPVLICVDDAHWADAASIGFLCYLARRIEGLAVLVVYAARSGDTAGRQLPAAAGPGETTSVLRPRALSEQATTALVARATQASGDAELGRACHLATGGNPFLLAELLRALQSDGILLTGQDSRRVAQLAPDAITQAISARLRALGSGPARLARAVAVLGNDAQLHHAAALGRLDRDSAVDAADVLTVAAILDDSRPLQFIHPIVRTTIYRDIPAGRRAALHRRAAALLARGGAPDVELAAHLIASEPADDPDVVRRLRSAAREVRHRGAPDAACAYLTRALQEPPRGDAKAELTYELGSAELAAGQPSAISHLREALQGDLGPVARAACAVEYAMALLVAGRVGEGIELLDASISSLRAAGRSEAAMEVEGILLAAAQLDPSTCGRVRGRLASYEGRLDGGSVGEQTLLASLASAMAHRPVPATRAAELAERALAEPRRLLERHPHGPSFPLAAAVLAYADRVERADELYTLAVDFARERGSVIGFASATGPRCIARLQQGRIAEAEAEARSCLEATAHVWIIGRPMLISCVLDAMLERSDLQACWRFLDEMAIGEDLTAVSMARRMLRSRGHLRLLSGDAAGALRDFGQIRNRERRAGCEAAAIPTRAEVALALAQLGETERARQLAHEQLGLARVWGAPSPLSQALRVAGTVTGGADGISLLREATEVLEHSPPRYERALALTAYGAALRCAGRRAEARDVLRQALELADRFGALRTAEQARSELLATGARPRRVRLSGADALTPSQRRIALLAAEGHSNRQIAQELFITIRTVETHLGSVYDKLGVRGRDGLAGALGAGRAPADAVSGDTS